MSKQPKGKDYGLGTKPCRKCGGNAATNKQMWTGTNGGNLGRCYGCNDSGLEYITPAFNLGTIGVKVSICSVTGSFSASILPNAFKVIGRRKGQTEKEAVTALVDFLKECNYTGAVKIERG